MSKLKVKTTVSSYAVVRLTANHDAPKKIPELALFAAFRCGFGYHDSTPSRTLKKSSRMVL